jgi:hypothetical protein
MLKMGGAGVMLDYNRLGVVEPKIDRRASDLSALEDAVKKLSGTDFKNFLKSCPWLTYSWSDYEWALHIASKEGKLEIVKVLVDEKTNIHSKDEYALRWAAENKHDTVVHFLIKKGANINALFPSVKSRYVVK